MPAEYRVEVQARAIRDLTAIGLFVRASQSDRAREWFAGLSQAILSLHEMPERGALVKGSPAYRQFLYGTGADVYRILYRVLKRDRVVIVLHVRHGARAGTGV